jgi:CheY-like chemotaxis protein
LVVEDNPVNPRVALRLLERLGTRADVAGNGREALAMLGKFPYDVVFMDCQMPEMDGYEATERLRCTEGSNRNVRIIALTADALAGSRDRCLAAGMNAFIAKPTRLTDFVAALGDKLVQVTEESLVS